MLLPATRRTSIGVFDSGVGGLSVLKALLSSGPDAALHYVADSAHAPYGERSADEIETLSTQIASMLIEGGARLVVVACNTATACAIDPLRARWPDVRFVGIEPAIKPAMAATRNGRVGVLATHATLASERFAHLLARHAKGAEVVLQPCAGLAAAIERNAVDDPALQEMAAQYAEPLIEAEVDTVVLGCTHYPLLRATWEHLFGPCVTILDPADAVASRVRALWQGPHGSAPTLQFHATGDGSALRTAAARWLGLDAPVRAMELAHGARDRDRTGTPPLEGGGV